MADRWTCRSCWTANEASWDQCLRCKLPHGAEASAVPAAPTDTGGAPGWQRLTLRFLGVGIFAFVAIFGALNAASRDDSGAIVGSGTLQITDVRVGDCFDPNDGLDVEEVDDIRAIPCDEPHSFEAYHTAELASGPYPSRSQLDAELEAASLAAFETYVGRDYEGRRVDADRPRAQQRELRGEVRRPTAQFHDVETRHRSERRADVVLAALESWGCQARSAWASVYCSLVSDQASTLAATEPGSSSSFRPSTPPV